MIRLTRKNGKNQWKEWKKLLQRMVKKLLERMVTITRKGGKNY